MGALDWARPCDVTLDGGLWGLGWIRGGPFPENVAASVASRYGPRPSFDVEISSTKLPGETIEAARLRHQTQRVRDGGDFWLVTLTTRDRHDGDDYVSDVPAGADVLAVGGGLVSMVSLASQHPSSGNWVEIEHGDSESGDFRSYGIRTRYAHLAADPPFQIGQMVERGRVLGTEDTSGLATGRHLHFEVVYFGVTQDPRAFLVFSPDIGQPSLPPAPAPPQVGDVSPPLHQSLINGIAAGTRNGVLVIPRHVTDAHGDERYVSIRDGIPRLVVAGTRYAGYELYVPFDPDLP